MATPSLVEMGHHALACRNTSLGWGALAQWRWRRGSVGGLRGKGLKAPMGSITIGKVRSVLRVTPHPPFIAFRRGFRVLSPWSGI